VAREVLEPVAQPSLEQVDGFAHPPCRRMRAHQPAVDVKGWRLC
jgi:hypothetical protein